MSLGRTKLIGLILKFLSNFDDHDHDFYDL